MATAINNFLFSLAAAIDALVNPPADPGDPVAYVITLSGGTVMDGEWRMVPDNGGYSFSEGTLSGTLSIVGDDWRLVITDDGDVLASAQWHDGQAAAPSTDVADWIFDFGNVLPVLDSIVAEYPPAVVPPRSIWVHNAVEAQSAAVYSVLRIYGGPAVGAFAGARVPAVSVQVDTRGKGDAGAVLAAAWAIHEALLDSDGRPRMHWAVAGKVIAAGAIADDPAGDWEVRAVRFNGPPGIIGRDDSDRWMAMANFDVEFEFAPAT